MITLFLLLYVLPMLICLCVIAFVEAKSAGLGDSLLLASVIVTLPAVNILVSVLLVAIVIVLCFELVFRSLGGKK